MSIENLPIKIQKNGEEFYLRIKARKNGKKWQIKYIRKVNRGDKAVYGWKYRVGLQVFAATLDYAAVKMEKALKDY